MARSPGTLRRGSAGIVAVMCVVALSLPSVASAGVVPAMRPSENLPQADSAPGFDSFWISGGQRFVDRREVDLLFGARSSGAIDEIRVSNEIADGELVSPDLFGTSRTIRGWLLASGDDGERAVHAQVRSGDEWSAVMTDTIVLDTTAPVGSFDVVNETLALGDPWSTLGGVSDPLTRMDVRDDSFARGGSVRIATTVDELAWREHSPDGSVHREQPDSMRFTHEIVWSDRYSRPAGPILLKARWRDEAGNWSDVETYILRIRQYLPVATLFVDGNVAGDDRDPATREANDVSIRVRIDHMPVGPDGEVADVGSLRIGGEFYGPKKRFDMSGRSSITFDWSLVDDRFGYTNGDGLKDVYIWLDPSVGRERSLKYRVILDRVTPTSTEPVAAVAIGSVVGTGGAGVTATTGTRVEGTVAWKKANDRGKSGIGGYRVQRSDASGTWRSAASTKASVTKATADLRTSRATRFRVQATDRAGNRGAWRTGALLRPQVIPEGSSSIRYKGRWTTETRDDALGGRLRMTSTIGGSASLTFTGYGVAWVAPRTPDGDAVDVYIDGRKVKVAHLTSTGGYQARRVVFSTAWAKRGRHTIRIVHRYRDHEMPLDAFIVLR